MTARRVPMEPRAKPSAVHGTCKRTLVPTSSTGRIHIGCSGWQYKAWRGRFYPDNLPLAQWLQHYASVFDTVEVNNTFYRLARRSTLEKWASTAPSGFTFVLKASRYLTHLKR